MRLRRRHDDTDREVAKTDEEWKAELAPEAYAVLRGKGTERPFTNEHVVAGDDGAYRCGGCDAVLFRAGAKFDSGTGWPSFSEAEPGAVDRKRDWSMGIPRTEVVCHRCGGHLGHVFKDGPGPNGDRYCINGCALR